MATTRSSTPAPTASAAALYLADFANWPTGAAGSPTSARGRFDRATGSYELALTDPSRNYAYSLIAPNAPKVVDFELEVDARRVSGPEQGSYGVTFRIQPQGQSDKTAARYNLLIHPDTGAVGLTWTSAQDVGTVILPHTVTTAVNQGTGENHLTVIARGDAVTIAVNGHMLGTYHADHTDAGLVGLIVLNPPQPAAATGMAAAFSNLKLSAPPAVSSAAQAEPGPAR